MEEENKSSCKAEIVKETMDHLSKKQSDMLISSVSYSIRQIPEVAKTFAITLAVMLSILAVIASIIAYFYYSK